MANSHKLVVQADAHAPATHASTHNAGGTDAMTNPQFTTIELGAASDTTIARASAGNLTVEGNALYRAGGTDVAVTDGGTGASTAAAGFNALSPMTTSGDVIYGGASGAGTRLAKGSDGQVLTLASGVPSWAAAAGGATTFAGCRVSNSGNVAISDSTVTIVTWDTETFDVGGYHSTVTNTGRITCPSGKDGYYNVEAQITWVANATGTRWVAIYKNGSLYQVLLVIPGTTTALDSLQQISGSCLVLLAATDYLECRVYQTSTGSLNVSAGDGGSSFAVTFVGA